MELKNSNKSTLESCLKDLAGIRTESNQSLENDSLPDGDSLDAIENNQTFPFYLFAAKINPKFAIE